MSERYHGYRYRFNACTQQCNWYSTNHLSIMAYIRSCLQLAIPYSHHFWMRNPLMQLEMLPSGEVATKFSLCAPHPLGIVAFRRCWKGSAGGSSVCTRCLEYRRWRSESRKPINITKQVLSMEGSWATYDANAALPRQEDITHRAH